MPARIRPSGLVAVSTPLPDASDAVRCRCCRQPVEAKWQPSWNGRPGFRILTCRNALCGLGGFTFSEPEYPTLDLAKYLKGHAK